MVISLSLPLAGAHHVPPTVICDLSGRQMLHDLHHRYGSSYGVNLPTSSTALVNDRGITQPRNATEKMGAGGKTPGRDTALVPDDRSLPVLAK